MNFEKKVWKKCKEVPFGKVTTYGEIAQAISTSARAVGRALSKSPGMPKVPCHRVIRKDGKLGGFAFGKRKKVEMLKKECIEIIKGKIDLNKYFYKIS